MITKNAFNFSHDFNARNDEKILRLRMRYGAAGYGIYFMLIERLAEESAHVSAKDYDMLAFELREDREIIRSVVEDFGLFVFDDDNFYSASLNARLESLDDKRSKAIEAARARWGRNNDNHDINDDEGADKEGAEDADAMQTQCGCNADADAFALQTVMHNNNNNNNNNNNKKEKNIKKEKIFRRPTVDEVKAYCDERHNSINPQAFVDFYESKGWKVGTTPMKNWQAAVRTWERRKNGDRKEAASRVLGIGEYYTEDGIRTYGNGKVIIPDDAMPRPSRQHSWDAANQRWIVD